MIKEETESLDELGILFTGMCKAEPALEDSSVLSIVHRMSFGDVCMGVYNVRSM